MSLAVNIVLSFCIVLRLVIQRRRLSATGGQHGASYTSIAAMIIESAALFAVFNLCFIVPYIVNNPIQAIFLDMLGQVQVHLSCLCLFSQSPYTFIVVDHVFVIDHIPRRARKGLELQNNRYAGALHEYGIRKWRDDHEWTLKGLSGIINS